MVPRSSREIGRRTCNGPAIASRPCSVVSMASVPMAQAKWPSPRSCGAHRLCLCSRSCRAASSMRGRDCVEGRISNCEGDDGVMRNGRWDGTTCLGLWAFEPVLLIGTIRGSHQGVMWPQKQAGHMTCTRPHATRQNPLAIRAPSTHDPSAKLISLTLKSPIQESPMQTIKQTC